MEKYNSINRPEPNQARSVAAIRPSPEMPEMHFVLQAYCHTLLMPLETLLRCLRDAEKQGEEPVIPEEWWSLLKYKCKRHTRAVLTGGKMTQGKITSHNSN